MKIQQLIEEQMKEFDFSFYPDLVEMQINYRNRNDGNWKNSNSSKNVTVATVDDFKSFIKAHSRKLIEAVGSEIIGHKYKINPRMKNRNFYLWKKGYNESVDDSRDRLKEIISSIQI